MFRRWTGDDLAGDGMAEDVKLTAIKGMSMNSLSKLAYSIACKVGWWDDERSFGDMIALLHTEPSEALEEYRNGHGYTETYYRHHDDKPEGIPSELADTIIRVLDIAGHLDIDIGKALAEKMIFNSKRPHKHGGKRL